MKTMCLLMPVLLFLTLHANADEINRPNIFDHAVGQFSLQGKDTRIILGRLNRFVEPQPAPSEILKPPIPIKYFASVVFEWQGRIPEGSEVEIDGQFGMQGSYPVEIPRLKPGDIFLMAIAATNEKDRFNYMGEGRLPIGISLPCQINPDEIADVKAGLLQFEMIAKTSQRMIDKAESQKLIDNSKGNYFIWALGVTALSINGSKDDVQKLSEMYFDKKTPLRQILWLDLCFAGYFPEQASPSIGDRHEWLIIYLRSTVAGFGEFPVHDQR